MSIKVQPCKNNIGAEISCSLKTASKEEINKIKEALNDLGLKFLGFQLENSWIRNEFSKLYSEKDALVSLPLWHQFELKNPSIFSGMYQFWVKKA